MLFIHTSGEDTITLSKKMKRTLWETFQRGGSTHSSMGCTLGWLIRECERTRTPYRLSAKPGLGYYLEPLP
jgi:hypothetical protein